MDTASRSSSTSSHRSTSSTRPILTLTTKNIDDTTTPSTTSTRYYAHLLYVDTPQRERIMSRANSSSTSSIRSQVSTRAPSDTSSHTSNHSEPPVTPSTKFHLSPITTPTYLDEHYPLITTTNPTSVPAHIPRTHTCFLAARHMAEIHNLFIRALNTIYNSALLIQPTPASATPFLHYCRVLCTTLNHHHEIEDTILFPAFEQLLNQPGAMSSNVDGHDAFLPGLHLFEAYVTNTKPQEYCGMTLRNMLERFAGELVQHLHEEIPTLIDLWRVGDVEGLAEVWAKAEREGSRGGSLWEAPCFVLGNVDREMVMDGEVCGFPELPRAGRWVVRRVLGRRWVGSWGFCAFDWEGRRRRVLG